MFVFIFLLVAELFNFILKLVKTEKIEDAIIVPVSVTYEKFPEEQIINDNGTMNSPGFFSQLRKLLKKRLGFVRVDFGHPFSVRVRFKHKNVTL